MPITFKIPGQDIVFKVPDEYAGKVASFGDLKIRIPLPQAEGAPEMDDEDEPGLDELVDLDADDAASRDDEDTGGLPDLSSKSDDDDVDLDELLGDDDEDDDDDSDDIDLDELLGEDDDGSAESSTENETDSDDDDMDDIEDMIAAKSDSDDDDDEDDDDDDEDDDEGDDEDDDDDDDDDEAGSGPQSWPGRLLVWSGAACLLASLFLTWGEFPAAWHGGDGDAIAYSGLTLATEVGGLSMALFGAVGAAVLLSLVLLIPSMVAGGLGMALGLLLAVVVPGALGACLQGAGGSEGIGGAFGIAGLGVWLALAGAVLNLVGGLLCSLGVLKGGGDGPAVKKGTRGGKRGAGRTQRIKTSRAKPSSDDAAADDDGDGDDEDDEDEKPKKPVGKGKLPFKKKAPLKPGGAKKKPPFMMKKKAGGKKMSKKIQLKPRIGKKSSRKK